jgi:hypothetical protein
MDGGAGVRRLGGVYGRYTDISSLISDLGEKTHDILVDLLSPSAPFFHLRFRHVPRYQAPAQQALILLPARPNDLRQPRAIPRRPRPLLLAALLLRIQILL